MSKILPLMTLFTLVAAGCGEEEIDGSAIWAQKCTVCHAEDAAGNGSTPDIRGDLAEMSIDEIVDTVLNGSQGGAMVQIAVSEAEAEAVAEWAKTTLSSAE